MRHAIDLTAADGFTFPTYVAQPASNPKGGIVLLQEIFGVNSHIRSVAEGYNDAGYRVVAPATFHRVKPGVELGYTEADINEGFGYKSAAVLAYGSGMTAGADAALRPRAPVLAHLGDQDHWIPLHTVEALR